MEETNRVMIPEMPTNTFGEYKEMTPSQLVTQFGTRDITEVETFNNIADLWIEENLNKAFLDDPIKLIPNRQIFSKYCENSNIDDNQLRDLGKKSAVIAYYSKQFRLPSQIVEKGIDEINRQVFGKDMTIDEVYNIIHDIKLREAQNDAGILEKTGRNLYAGLMLVDKGLADTARMVVDSAEAVNRLANYLFFEPLEWAASKLDMPDLAAFFHAQNFQNAAVGDESIIEKGSNWFRSYSEAEQRAIEHQIQWAGEDNFLWQFVRNAPQIVMAILLNEAQALSMANKATTAMNVVNTGTKATQTVSAASAYFGTTSFASEWYDTENSGMSNAERLMNALAVGGAEFFFEQEFGAGRLFRKYRSKAIPEKEVIKLSEKFGANLLRTVKSIGLDASVEGLEEVGTGITQRFSNLLYGKDGKTLSQMSLSDIAYELLSPTPTEFGLGALSGGIMGGVGFKYRYNNELQKTRHMNFNSDRIVVAKQRLAELQAIKNPTESDIKEIEWLQTNIAERNYNALWNEEFKQYIKKMQEVEDDKLSQTEYGEKLFREGLAEAKELQSLENEKTEERHIEAIDSLINQSLKSLKLDGMDIELVKSVKDLPQEFQENGVEGVYDIDSKRIYLVAENLTAGRVKKVILHEAVGHKGLRAVMGENYDGFLRQIGAEHAADIQKIAQKRNFNLDNQAQYLEAVDEFLAEFAENGFDNNIWQSICANFRLLLRRMGLDISYTDNELRELFRRGRNALRNQQQLSGTNGENETRFALRDFSEEKRLEESKKLKIFEDNFLKILDDFANGVLPKDKEFELGATPDALTMLQVPQLPISISGKIFDKAQNKHNLTIDELKQIPAALYNPVMIFDSSDQSTNFNNGMVVLTQIHDSNKKPIVIALNIAKTSRYHKINDIASIYGKNNVNQIIDWINDGFLRYSHKNRALAFARFHRLQLPKNATISERSNNTIIDESTNVKPIFEKNQKKLRFSLKNGENAPVLEVDWEKEGSPHQKDYDDVEPIYWVGEERTLESYRNELEGIDDKKNNALKDTLNAEDYNGQRFDDIFDEEWQEMSEDERIEHIEGSYEDRGNELYREIEELNETADWRGRDLANKKFEADYEYWWKSEQLLIPARDMTRAYAESLGYTIIEEDENSSGTSYYLKVNNGKDDMTLRFSDHEQPYYKWNGERVTYMRDGKQYTAYNDVEAVIEDFELDLAPIWEFLEEFAPQGNEGTDNGVRYSIAPQVDTPEFKNWFKDSKVVDENGEPLVVYHGSSAEFTVFSHKFAMRNGAADGRGFYFTSDKSKAEGYKTESGKLFEVYLRLQKPLQPNELTITKHELEKIIRAIDVDGDYISNYAEDDRGYPGKAWFDKAVKRAVDMIYESSDDNADIIAEIYSSFGQGDALAKITEATGYDGFIKDDVFVVFSPNQIKSATDNIGTFDPNNPDIRFSINDNYPIDQKKLEAFKKIIWGSVSLTYNDISQLEMLLIENGVKYDHEKDYRTLNAAIQLARQEIRERNKKIRNMREHAVMAKKDKFYKILSQKYGKDFKLNAGSKYDGVVFIGDWMDKHKTEKGRKNSIKIEEAAKVLSEALGEDISAELVLEHFKSLKKSGLLAEYREKKRDKRFLAELAEEIAEEERMEITKDEFLGNKPIVEDEAMRKAREKYIKDKAKYRKAEFDNFVAENMPELYTWVMDILPVGGKIKPTTRFMGEEFTGDWIPREWKIYSLNKPGKKTGLQLMEYSKRRENALAYAQGMNSDEIAQAIASKYGGDAAQIEEDIINLFRDLKRSDLRKMYIDEKIKEKNQLKEEYAEYDAQRAAESFQILLEAARMEKINIIRVQDLAKKHVKKFIPAEMQGRFIEAIVKLNNYSDNPSPTYPEGRRNYELEKLLRNIHSFNAKTRIMELLAGTKIRVNSAGIPISNFGDNSNTIAKIRDIVQLQPVAVERIILNLNDRIAQAEIDIENGIENSEDPNELRAEKGLYEMFGKLDLKTPEELSYALKELRYLIDQNKQSLFFRLKNKLQENSTRNHKIMQEISGKTDIRVAKKTKDPDKKLSGFWAKNAGLKNLLNLITNKSNKAFEDTELGKLFEEIEEATWKGAALDRQSMENASTKLYEFFGLKGLKAKKDFFESINATPEHTGIFFNRYEGEKVSHFDPAIGEEVTITTDRRGFLRGKISVAHARKLIAEYDSGTGENQKNNLGIEFLKEQLKDFDLGIDQTYDLFGNADENESWKIIKDKTGTLSKEDLEKKTQLLFIKPLNQELEKVTSAEWIGSKAEAANLLMAWEQPDVQLKMRWNGWTDESIDQLKKYMGDTLIQYAYYLRDTIKENSKAINDLALEIYGVGLPNIENYFPTSYSESLGKKIGKTGADSVVGDSYGNLSISPQFLIARKFHLGEVDLNRSIFDSYLKYSLETNHFKAMAKIIRKSRSIFNNADVRSIIVENYGKEVYDQIIDRIKTIADGGRAGGEAAKLLSKMFKYWVPAKIALNLSSFAKQIAGATSYMNNIPIGDYIRYTKDSFGDSMFNDFVESVKNSEYFKNRQAGAMNRDLYYAIRSMNAGTTEDIYGAYMLDNSTKMTKLGDTIAMLRGGYAVFKYHYMAAKADGLDDSAAWEKAMQLYQRATDETQQSGYLKDQNFYQSQAGMYRYLTAFLSNPIQIMNLQLETINDIRFGSGARKAQAKEKLTRQLIINHVVVPFLMTAITQFFRHGRDFDEYEWEDFFTAFLLGPFEGAFLAGKIASAFANEMGDMIVGRHKFGSSTFSAMPIVDDTLLAMLKLMRSINDEEFDSETVFNVVQSLADLSLGVGTVTPIKNLGAIGAAASAALRETKRIFRLGKNLINYEE